ncbi:MAG: 4Fe-4S binding protein [Christensenella sp.]|uniref:4Fe-4S binding protein n=1 Tax=Christensenella sp. TaxID=1935934 RepID=UPI002B1F78A6|nr:4Fe-4S binding protein [Christensenella sp.]MEA5003497.1 4Fe-4S binding protein [Christensenella sp.]
MDITAIYFSPTGGTKQYVQKIAGALGETYASLDLSDRETRLREHTFSKDDLVVIGVPVYYGRVVQIDNGLLKRLHGDGTRAILVAVYGNRAFDDALLELSDLCAKQDFVTAAAFTGIAQHTFSEKIATGRPNADDLLEAERFAQACKDKLSAGGDVRGPVLPGNHPYRPYGSVPFAPRGDNSCTSCGVCAKICPAGAIDPTELKKTDTKKCIRCFACIKVCPVGVRKVTSPVYRIAVKKLEDNLTKLDRQCESFL